MNRKFFISGLIIRKLMTFKNVSMGELAERMNRTRASIHLIRNRGHVKDSLAQDILEKLNFTMEEVEKMDEAGVFLDSFIPFGDDKVLELEEVNKSLKNTEKSLQEVIKKQNEYITSLEENLKNKDTQIATLITLLGKN